MVIGWFGTWAMTAQAAEPFEVLEAVLCERVEARRCIGPRVTERQFPDSVGQVYLFTRIKSEAKVDTFHVWYHEGRVQEQDIAEGDLAERIRTVVLELVRRAEELSLKVPKLENASFAIKLRAKPSPSYRTWSAKSIDPSRHVGKWAVKIMDASGKEHTSLDFEVVKGQ
jgi:hypothetical protein